MQIVFESSGKTLVVKMEGELDHHTSAEIRERIDREIEKGAKKNLIFDFGKLTFMDSSGIGVIIGRYKQIQNIGGKVAIANVNPHAERIINISGLHKIFPIYNSTKDALQNI